jgi:hypothetical protein
MISTKDAPNSLLVWPGRGWPGSKNRQKALTLIMTLMTGLTFMNLGAAAQQAARTTESELTCNINGIPPQDRARYGRLVEVLRRAIQERRELPDGYAFQMDTKQFDTDQLVEWIKLERQCCPFFGFEVHWDRKNGPVWFHLTGPEGVKEFILDEFGLR